MKGKTLLLLVGFLCFVTGYSQSYNFRHLDITDGISQVCIPSIYQDEIGALWFGTSEGLNRYNGHDIRIFRPSQSDEGLTYNEITAICGDKNGRMYIRSGSDLVRLDIDTEQFTCLRRGDVASLFCRDSVLWVGCNDGVYTYDGHGKELRLFIKVDRKTERAEALWADTDTLYMVTRSKVIAIPKNAPSRQKILLSGLDASRCIMKSASSGDIWVGCWNGVYRISPQGKISYFPPVKNGNGPSSSQTRCIVEDDFGQIWIGTFRGLDCCVPVSADETRWKHFTRYGNTSNTLRHHSIMSLLKDNAGNIWVGTYYGGVHVFNPDEATGHFYEADQFNEDNLSFPVVGRMAEDQAGNLWICTEGGGLNCLHADSGMFSSYKHLQGDLTTPGSNNLKAIYYRRENNTLYVGAHWGGLYVLDLSTGKGHTLHHSKDNPYSLPHDIVNDIQPYKDGLAVLTQGGPVFFNPESERCTPLVSDMKVQQMISDYNLFETFRIDSKQRMWLAFSRGGLVCVDLRTNKVTHYENKVSDSFAIGKFVVVHIYESDWGDIFFATVGSGMFRYVEKERSFKSYSTSNGSFPCDYCYYISGGAGDRKLYVLHHDGVSVFDCDKEKAGVTRHYYNQTYCQGSSLYKSRNGMLYVSGSNGLVSSKWDDADAVSSVNLKFDRLYVLNEEIHPGGADGILRRILSKTSEISLSHRQNNLSVEFSSFNYGGDLYNLFEYKLDGFDKVWTQTSSNKVTYTSLPPGKYVLCVRPLSYSSEEATSDEIRLGIHIAPPFYQTWWAYLFYICCVVALGAMFVRLRTRQLMLRSSLEYERKEKERIEGLNQLKLRFFTNISHEFRTPLTLIIGQIEVMLHANSLNSRFREHLQSVYRNAWHMRNLISELLDFRKQEQGFLKLRVEEKDLVPFVRQIYMCFSDYARQRKINYLLEGDDTSISLWFDPVQLQKVIFNLLSNAFKYTSAQGCITVKIEKKVSAVTVSVSDTGVGIPEEEIDKIFNRFYQTRENSPIVGGTGIGLALAEGIMSLHHGSIDVKSKVGEGTTFTLSLRLGHNHFGEDEMAGEHAVKNSDVLPDIVPITPYEQNGEASEKKTDDGPESDETNRPVVLIVEDNEELLYMLRDVFASKYIVHTATNGEDGFEIAQQEQPNLIVSDVMMPRMTGTELCHKIKDSVELSHISVVLLTAKASEENEMEGLMYGADEYMSKPFSMKMLMAKCEAILQNKKRLLEYYKVTEYAEKSTDDTDLKHLLEVCVPLIKENFMNSDFGVEDLSKAMGLGRTNFYKQFRKLLGVTPNEFILKVKFDEAMQMLKTRPDMNLTEISLELGFSSLRYFSRTFKTYFGVTPQSVRSELKNSDDASSANATETDQTT